MNIKYEKIDESAKYIKEKINVIPKVAIILGSGLGDFVNNIENAVEIEYKDIPNFPVSTVKGHAGKLVIGNIQDKQVIAMNGRFHYYEGYSMEEVTFPIRVFKLLGIEKLIIISAVGAVNADLKTGDLVIVNDYIKLTDKSPLIGSNMDEFGHRFPNMNKGNENELIKNIFIENNLPIKEGVYAFMAGPQYETKAEINMLRILGADVVGMSTVPEIIVAKHMDLDITTMCCVTNAVSDGEKLSHEDVVKVAKEANTKLTNVLLGYINRI